MKYRIRSAGLFHNDHVFGIANSGAMDEDAMLGVLARLQPGVTEIYLHPASQSESVISPSMPAYRHSDELAALLSLRVRTAVRTTGIKLGGYGDVLQDLAGSAAVYSGQ